MFKKSGLQKRREINAARAEKARHGVVDVYCDVAPKGSLLADKKTLREVNPLGPLPNFYVDRHFECKDCGSDEIWTAKQQKWWLRWPRGAFHLLLSFADRADIKKNLEKQSPERCTL